MPKCHASTVVLFLSLAFLARLAAAADYYVSPDGNDGSAGTSISVPWRTIAKANRAAAPGDVVHLRGGQYLDDPIAPARSGRAGAPIRYAAYQGETPILTSGKIRGLDVAIDLANRSYITVDGVHVDGEKPNPQAHVNHFLEILAGSYNTVSNCTFRHAHGWHGIRLDDGAHHNVLSNNVVDVVGVYDDGNGDDWGDVIQIHDAHHNLLQRNTITRGAHNLLQVQGQFNVIRGNVFENDWSELLGAGKGGRNLSLMGGHNIFEGNVVRGANASADKASNAGMKVEGRANIVRRNFIYGNSNEGIVSQSRSGQKWARSNHIFHNTLYSNGGPAWGVVFYNGGNGVSENVFKNNIVYANGGSSLNDADIAFRLAANPAGVVGDSLVEGNLMAKQAGADVFVEIDGGGGRQTLQQAEQAHAKSFKQNIPANPIFVSTDPEAPADFALAAGSRGIDEAVPLTRTTGLGSGTVIGVEDAGYFSDGFSLVPGDRIRIGSGAVLQVVGVDYSANTIAVLQPARWQAEDAVSLEFSGEGPDIGAHEAGLGTGLSRRPQAPGGLSTRVR